MEEELAKGGACAGEDEEEHMEKVATMEMAASRRRRCWVFTCK